MSFYEKNVFEVFGVKEPVFFNKGYLQKMFHKKKGRVYIRKGV